MTNNVPRDGFKQDRIVCHNSLFLGGCTALKVMVKKLFRAPKKVICIMREMRVIMKETEISTTHNNKSTSFFNEGGGLHHKLTYKKYIDYLYNINYDILYSIQ